MGTNTEVVIAFTTLPLGSDVRTISRILVEDRLAACVTTHGPVCSVYRWHGKIEEAQEQSLVIKTTRARVGLLCERLRQLHPYELPEFVVVPVSSGNGEYLDWIEESTRIGGV